MVDLQFNDARVLHVFKDQITTIQIAFDDEFAIVQEGLTKFYKIDLDTNAVAHVVDTKELVFR